MFEKSHDYGEFLAFREKRHKNRSIVSLSFQIHSQSYSISITAQILVNRNLRRTLCTHLQNHLGRVQFTKEKLFLLHYILFTFSTATYLMYFSFFLLFFRFSRQSGRESSPAHWYKNRSVVKASMKARQMITWILGKEDSKFKNCENLQVL